MYLLKNHINCCRSSIPPHPKTTVFLCSLSHSFLGFRLNAPVLEVRNVSWRSACVDDCFANPCCRSMNYNHASSTNQSNKCELLHDLVDNTSHVLEPNSSFHHIFFYQPLKVIRTIQFYL